MLRKVAVKKRMRHKKGVFLTLLLLLGLLVGCSTTIAGKVMRVVRSAGPLPTLDATARDSSAVQKFYDYVEQLPPVATIKHCGIGYRYSFTFSQGTVQIVNFIVDLGCGSEFGLNGQSHSANQQFWTYVQQLIGQDPLPPGYTV